MVGFAAPVEVGGLELDPADLARFRSGIWSLELELWTVIAPVSLGGDLYKVEVPIDAAAREEVVLGAVDRSDSGGYWIWAVMDNLTCGGASNAMRIFEAVQSQHVH